MRNYRGIPSLQELECSGGNLKAEVKLLSLRLFKSTNRSIMAHVNPFTNECITFEEFSSCAIDTTDTRRTKLRMLVSDLQEEESRVYGCTANVFETLGDTQTLQWFITIKLPSE